MISFDEAVQHIRDAASPLAVDIVEVPNAAWRVLARPVVAAIDSPRTDVSAMDGYAVREQDLAEFPASLQLVGESFAGCGWAGQVAPGACVRIFTGAPVPPGADRVVIQENVKREGDIAVIERHPGASRHIRKRGGDFEIGDILLEAGRRLDPRAVVAAAGADMPEVAVYKQPLVTVLGTGDELAEPGTASAHADAIPESLSFGIAAMAAQWGARLVARERLADDLTSLTKAAGTACDVSDLIVVTGGASVGEKDFAKAMFEPFGLELIFSKVAIKPGKPIWFGRVGSTLVVGLPGNPTSAMTTARLFLAPLLCGLTGRPIEAALGWRSAPLALDLGPCGGRETFHRARWRGDRVHLLSNQDSSAQHALASADLLVRQAADSPAQPAGSTVQILDF